MEKISIAVEVPAPLALGSHLLAEDERNALLNRRRAAYGGAAVEVGSPDYGQNGDDSDGITTDAADAIANVLHWLEARGGDVDRAIARAQMNYGAESRGEVL
jgi:hypothetical protein